MITGATQAMTTWRKHSLPQKVRYRVTEEFAASTDTFQKDSVVTFVDTAHSAYDGMTGFRFRSETGQIMGFDVSDNDAIEDWTRKFEVVGKE